MSGPLTSTGLRECRAQNIIRLAPRRKGLPNMCIKITPEKDGSWDSSRKSNVRSTSQTMKRAPAKLPRKAATLHPQQRSVHCSPRTVLLEFLHAPCRACRALESTMPASSLSNCRAWASMPAQHLQLRTIWGDSI